MRRALKAAGVLFVAIGLSVSVPYGAWANAESHTTIPVTLETAHGRHTIQAEVACSQEERARGLMGRQRLAPDAGMIFLLATPRPMRLWMMDTPLSLDMIFFNDTHEIIRIESNAEPMSERVIESGGVAAGVLEIAGGRAIELKISRGNKVLYTYPQKRCE